MLGAGCGVGTAEAFLLSDGFRDREPNRRFHYGYHRATQLAYLSAALALFSLSPPRRAAPATITGILDRLERGGWVASATPATGAPSSSARCATATPSCSASMQV
jgi:hypothetical protein